ncbi:MAG: phosphoribosylanthranilate isomerase [Kordiimonadaceae bacterium]|jgi:phosphoribosylanthranilate isomerase|nr:phosphoribosylanthranilate isomerase [Kordiimonadaceae bacterium]MBT6035992.1 phosphoribosylanthranilate isomerase [Kordiimonadaceae bacterium]MBT6330131.1 phosphoribosylanthranilate isomerase [Kordiimonadaceae bacterium]MBT7582678.1 phosphoribosylanthranilate isomerase [Kordiimonadaceae bacterium]
MNIEAKICGLSTAETVRTALDAGASYVGFVFYPPSPRNISIEKAAELAEIVKEDALKVGVFVNPDDALLHDVFKQVDLDVIQLHGNETVERVQYIRNRFSKIVMKAISVASLSDIARAKEYQTKVDMLLFDAKAPLEMDDALPGGNGLSFDWNLISGYQWHVPWMLSGGLDEANVAKAIKISGAKIVDVSSGIEVKPGQKDVTKIKSFIKAVEATQND